MTGRFVTSNYDYSSSVTSIINRFNWCSLDARRCIDLLCLKYCKSLLCSICHKKLLHLTSSPGDMTELEISDSVFQNKFGFFPATVMLWRNSLSDYGYGCEIGWSWKISYCSNGLCSKLLVQYFSPNFHLLATYCTYLYFNLLIFTFITKCILYCTYTPLESCNYHGSINN